MHGSLVILVQQQEVTRIELTIIGIQQQSSGEYFDLRLSDLVQPSRHGSLDDLLPLFIVDEAQLIELDEVSIARLGEMYALGTVEDAAGFFRKTLFRFGQLAQSKAQFLQEPIKSGVDLSVCISFALQILDQSIKMAESFPPLVHLSCEIDDDIDDALFHMASTVGGELTKPCLSEKELSQRMSPPV